MLSSAFNFGDRKLRVYGTSEEPWFCGKDVCKILEYTNGNKAIVDHVDDEYIITLGDLISKQKLRGNMKNLKLINEQGLYCLIFNSKMKEAKKFRKWVFEEVLPIIRKNGAYVLPNISNEQIEKLQKQLEQRDRELEEERSKNQQLEKKQLVLTTIVDNFVPLEKKQIFYIATTKSYAAQNRFSITAGVTNGWISMIELFIFFTFFDKSGSFKYFCIYFESNSLCT